MNDDPRVSIRANTPGKVISLIPHLLGYQPAPTDMVVVGLARADNGRGRIGWVGNVRVPHREDTEDAAEAAHATLTHSGMRRAILVGYGTGQQVTPRMDVFRHRFGQAGVDVHEAVRVDEGRYWSYLCTDPACHPVEGTSLEADQLDASVRGQIGPAQASREDFAARLAPVTGARRDAQRQYTEAVERHEGRVEQHLDSEGVYRRRVAAVDQVIADARKGAPVSDTDHARVARGLRDIQVRDAAVARMDPAYAEAHEQLWTDATKLAEPAYVAAPATLLAFTAMQRGDGTLANVALNRAEADDPDYSLAKLVGGAIEVGAPPEVFAPPMTPAEVDEAYGFGHTQPEPAPAEADREAGE
jgi:hypothetical protein